ncbi:hypothetical protein CHRYSEO8AT_530109 [Chryseobacterium sp. 8AT]|nr:hypothetical protein CHRYSEO8AT_530109 [Chryseobacterium sp. 8AT]
MKKQIPIILKIFMARLIPTEDPLKKLFHSSFKNLLNIIYFLNISKEKFKNVTEFVTKCGDSCKIQPKYLTDS